MNRIAICDDDKVLCHQLEEMLLGFVDIHGGMLETFVFFDGKSLCEYMEQGERFDLLFLDIEMKEVNGILAGHRLREEFHDDDVQIVYISSKEQYAMELFAVRPMNFLIKPVSSEALHKVFQQAADLFARKNVLYEYRIQKVMNYISMKKIEYISVSNRTVTIHTRDEDIAYYGKMSEAEKKVEQQKFLKISRSELVNMDAVESYAKDCVILYSGKKLYISRGHQEECQRRMFEFVRE